VGRGTAEPGHAVHEQVEEDVAAHLAVGDHIDVGVLLNRDRLGDRTILDLRVGLGRQRAGAELLPGIDQPGWSEHRPDDVRPVDPDFGR
jgi:hypothetical protein